MTQNDDALNSEQTPEKDRVPSRGGWLYFFVGLALAVVIGWVIWPTLFYAKKTQPFSFKHEVHTVKGKKDCVECHFFDDQGKFSGAPDFNHCPKCHQKDKPQNKDNKVEKAFIEEYYTDDGKLKKTPPSWYVYSKQPDNVYFPHLPHVKQARIRCEYCHGSHDKTAKLPAYYENRLTDYSRNVWDDMKMNDCSSCHTNCASCHTESGQAENNACFTCHK